MPIARFDEGCAFCTRSTEFAKQRGARVDFEPGARSDTMVFVDDDGREFVRSDAALRVARRMRWPYSWLGALGLLVPRPIRDWAYDQVARRRHHLHPRA